MPRAKRTRRKHSVRASVQIHQLSKAGTSIDFYIYADEEKIGTMIIGRGSLTWFGRNRKTPIELNWTRFAQIMDERYDEQRRYSVFEPNRLGSDSLQRRLIGIRRRRHRFARRRRTQLLFALALFFLLLFLGEISLAFRECIVGFGQLTVLFRGCQERQPQV